MNEFLNVVVGRTISGWDDIGFKVQFGTPVFRETHRTIGLENSQAYLLVFEIQFDSVDLENEPEMDHIVLRVDFSKTRRNKIENKKILLVEDSRVMRNTIAKILRNEGAIVEEAEDGDEAIEIHMTFNPDLTLMDINMPKMDGFESISHIRRSCPDSKFIILSASSRKDQVVAAKVLETSGYMVKPVEPKQLIRRVTAVLAG